MTAIITEKTRRNLAINIFDDIEKDSNEYYLCIGRSEDWPNGDTTRTPTVTEREERLFRYSLQAVQKIDDNYRYVVPKYIWTSGTVYSAYNDNVASHPTTSFYVLTSSKNVYICIRQGKNAAGTAKVSLNVPTHTSGTKGYADGYVWRFMYTIGTSDYDNFVTSAFMPVDSASGDVISPRKQILGYRIINGGSNYTSAPTLTIVGNGNSATATAIRYGDTIVDVHPGDSANDVTKYGYDYDYASISVSGGGGIGAEIVPIFGPKLGLGNDLKTDLRSTAVMLTADFTASGDGKLVLDNDYRQVGIIKNIGDYGDSANYFGSSTSAYSSDTIGRAVKYMTVTSTTGFNADDTIVKTETAGTATAYVDYVDTANLRLWYHQTEDTGFINFTTGAGLSSSTSGGTATINSLTNPEVDIFSGDVLYIDNRDAIDRTIESVDDIKIVFQI